MDNELMQVLRAVVDRVICIYTTADEMEMDGVQLLL